MTTRRGAVFMTLVTVAAVISSAWLATTSNDLAGSFDGDIVRVAAAFDVPVDTVMEEPVGHDGTVAAYRLDRGDTLVVRWQPPAAGGGAVAAPRVDRSETLVVVSLPHPDGGLLSARWSSDDGFDDATVERVVDLLSAAAAP